MLRTLMTAAVAAGMMAGSAFATTVSPPPGGFDSIFVESNANRGSATGDIVADSIGSIGTNQFFGIGGRIFNFTDQFDFTTRAAFSVFFTDLGVDSNSGFDSTSIFGAVNGTKTAEFSLIDQSTSSVVQSVLLTSDIAPDTPLFSQTAAGSYSILIDGSVDIQAAGSTYDLVIATVPVPAALPLLGAGLGVLGLMRRRSRV